MKKKIINLVNNNSLLSRIVYGNFFKKIFYSQEGEDIIISELLKKNGFYIDIGAHHPFRFSNTALLYQKGWRGINVEPTPYLFNLFKKLRKRDINLNLGIGESKGELIFYKFDDPALNSFDKDLSEKRIKNQTYQLVGQEKVKVDTLSNVLEENLPKNTRIDLLSIDVEGLDFQVLKSNNWKKYKPTMIIVEETKKLMQILDGDIFQYLDNLGYELVAKTPRSNFYLLK